jgi:hypothetical protein
MENKETTKSRDDGLEVIAGDEGEFVHKPACNYKVYFIKYFI